MDAGAAQSWPWYAIYVKPRHEKTIAGILSNKGYEQFVPLFRRGQRKKQRDVPLFPSYVFCRFNPEDRLPVLTIPGVFFIVGMARRPIAVDEGEIRAIQAITKSGCYVEPCAFVRTGDWVRIDEGPLRGVEGILEYSDHSDTLIVSVMLLQRSVRVRIDRSCLRPIARRYAEVSGIEPLLASAATASPQKESSSL